MIVEDLPGLLDAYLARPNTRAAIEREIWDRYGATKTAFVADASEFTRRTLDEGIVERLAQVRALYAALAPVIARNGGHVLKQVADNLFACFDDPTAATATASQALALDNSLSIGICHGDLLLLPEDFFGHCVNIASRLGEDIGRAGEILIERDTAALLPAEMVRGFEDFAVDFGYMQLRGRRLRPETTR